MTVDLLRRRAEEDAERVAIAVDCGDRLTYAGWERRSSAQARGLVRAGVERGAPVVLVFDSARWPEYAVGYMAVQKAGAVAVPLSRELSAVEVARVVTAVGAALVVSPEDLVGVAPAGVRVVDPQSLEADGADEPGDAPARLPPDSAVEILCRSHPLAPLLLHRRSAADLGAHPMPAAAPSSEGGPRALLHVQPVGSVGGQTALQAALRDGPLPSLVLPAFDADRIAELIALGEIAVCFLDAALAHGLLDSGAAGRHDATGLEALVLTGRRRPAGLVERLRAALPRTSVQVVEPLEMTAPSGVPDPPDSGTPVSVAQEGMLWHEFFAPGCQNLQGLARRYQGPLDVDALRRALDEIVRRHRPLRTTFELRDGRLLQIVHPHGSYRLATRDLSDLPPEDREAAVERLVGEAGRRPFDLVTGPLFETTLLRLDADDHVLVIRTHHTAFDDLSVGVFRRELSALYGAYANGSESPFTDPPTGFDEAAALQREALAGPAGARQLAYWRRELAGGPLVTQLFVGDPSLPAGSPQPPGGPLTTTVPAELTAAIRDLARRERVTVFMALVAAFGVLTSRVTGQDDLLLSTIVANRTRTDLEGLIGSFAKKVPFRLRLDGDPTFVEVLVRARRSLLGALAAQDMPFEALVHEVLGPAAARHGLAPHPAVMFQAETPAAEPALPGLTSTGLATHRRATLGHFMAAGAGTKQAAPPVPWGAGLYAGTFVNIQFDNSGEQVVCTARGAFHAPAVRPLLEDFRSLLDALVAQPCAPVSSLVPTTRATGHGRLPGQVDLGGFLVDPARVEDALRGCRGVVDVTLGIVDGDDGERHLVADVVAPDPPPTSADLRAFLWSRLPGYAWPASFRFAGAPPERGPDSPDSGQSFGGPATPAAVASILHALCGEEMPPDGADTTTPYWQWFPFLEALGRARDAGLPIPGRLAARNRTIEALATAVSARRR